MAERKPLSNAKGPETLLMVKAVADKLDAQKCTDSDAPSLIVYRRADTVVSADLVWELMETVRIYILPTDATIAHQLQKEQRLHAAIKRIEEALNA